MKICFCNRPLILPLCHVNFTISGKSGDANGFEAIGVCAAAAAARLRRNSASGAVPHAVVQVGAARAAGFRGKSQSPAEVVLFCELL
jgi:hypothetical protein